MKTKFIYAGISMLLTLSLTGCSDEVGGKTSGGEGEMTDVRISIQPEKKSRSVSRAEEEATTDEKAFDKTTVRLYIYKDNGTLEYKNESVTLEPDNSYDLRITTGKKYFYVFVNTGTKPIIAKSMRGEFEKQILDVGFSDAGDTDNPDLAGYTTGGSQTRNFFMGTLWGGISENIEAGRDKETKPVVLEIGRIIAKVKLWQVEKGTYPTETTVQGAFTDFNYRTGGVALKTYLVGQYTPWGTPPPGAYTKVTSAVHSEGNYEANDPTEPNKAFKLYDNWKPVSALISGAPADNYFYVTENTTEKSQSGFQYFHNTTFIQLRSKYTPHNTNEIYRINSNDLEGPGSYTLPTDGTFWTIVKDGIRYIVNEDPDGIITADPDTEINHYVGGLNYHKFPIQDLSRDKDDVETKNSVLRNHYYEIDVTSIKDLGDPTETIDPEEPIPNEIDVRINVTIKDWTEITQSVGI